MLEAVFFDVGNTLLYPHPSVSEVVRIVLCEEGHIHDLSAIESLMPLVDEYYEERYRIDDSFWSSESETAAVWVGMYSLLCRRLGIDADAERIARRVYDQFGDSSRWRAYDDVVPALGRLKQRGIGVGLISNWDSRLAGLMEGLGIAPLLGTVVSSAEVGLHKPDPRIFELACARLGVSPANSVHVGDHEYADILGATAAGLTPVLIDRHGGPDPGRARFLRTLENLESVIGLGEGA